MIITLVISIIYIYKKTVITVIFHKPNNNSYKTNTKEHFKLKK